MLEKTPVTNDNASRARAQIRDLIRNGDVARDGKLPPERDLCARFDISRRAVRRALDSLEAEGLIWRHQGKGTFVGERPDPKGHLAAAIAPQTDPMTVMEARLAIEPELAALCARRATADDVARMRDLASRTSQAADRDAAELWDGSLHRYIARIADNAILHTAFSLINEVRGEQRWQTEREMARSPALRAEYDKQHASIIDAIHLRDEDLARQAMRAHLTELRMNLERVRKGGSE
ncbi:transcriptional regulator, GntR family [Roseibacterium elongatum DSM 19469]|uniref:Transcriptional regulator, GntR family n=1 Tax=Roseicyclus elongatus DSM 19469 TaxID=1294273 RepID=W8RNP5_9RHOB|nr:FCD domain-containing protein [Roseibacterium elongatum]AHM02774.1 transcriptional regulator, GntR family [Roseibacterium elongatum DSM 19469]